MWPGSGFYIGAANLVVNRPHRRAALHAPRQDAITAAVAVAMAHGGLISYPNHAAVSKDQFDFGPIRLPRIRSSLDS